MFSTTRFKKKKNLQNLQKKFPENYNFLITYQCYQDQEIPR